MNKKTRTLCEAAVMIALAQILSYIRIYRFPDGGSVDPAMLPIIIFAVRAGLGWGTGAGFVFGVLQYFLGNGIAIDWTTLVGDYLVAYTLLGFGAGLGCYFRRGGLALGTLFGCLLRFGVHLMTGVYIWGVYMPESFFGMTMTGPWLYSALYNGSYMALDFAICIILVLILGRAAPKYFHPGCLDKAA